ncbi:molybdopterin-dependent oxidoreductase [Streptomyces sp. NBC_01016]|uniref:molybdopterin-dependent oxidoreductase n=1 Tax=Streptomyces sp. NBC_01016 TaxID=2903720 RepID=UPI00225B0093|nr:molybdopterin-dependent oxidoreductase [Streptomyces sp. NBC_01016]MCX4832706.1 molybdopterin-dependent oxidoreductase [Streptomyces sp. NBC_01016]
MSPRPPDPRTPPSTVTPVDSLFVRTHLGAPPELDAAEWELRVEGLVEHPLTLDLPALLALPQHHLTSVHECFGSPFAPDVPTRAVTNLEWTGVPLSTVLDRARPTGAARHVWFEGADHGDFADEKGIGYVKDLPLARAHSDVLLAHSLNGAPLPVQHGFPVRAVVPHMFGTNSVKWLTRLVVSDVRPDHLFTTRLYNRDGHPVRDVDVNSKLLAPYDGDEIPSGDVELTGRAWSTSAVAGVEVSVDATPWRPAELEPTPQLPYAWTRFTLDTTLSPGPHRIRSRATDTQGRVQPPPGARNSVHEIEVRAR